MCKHGKLSRWDDRRQERLTNIHRRNTAFRSRHCVRIWCLISVKIAFHTAAFAQTEAAPVDANALVGQMVVNYQSLQTLQEDAENRFLDDQGNELIQTAQLKYKRPNLIYLETRDPKNGTLLTYSNGRLATFYSGKQNSYMHRNAAASIIGTLAVMSRASMAVIGMPQTQVLNPLSFLGAKRRPVEATHYRYVKTVILEGKRVALIAAVADPDWINFLYPAYMHVALQKREILLWIDLNTKFLVRSSCDIVLTLVLGGKDVSGRIRFVETHRHVTPNVSLRDEDFDIAPPKGAEEIFPTKQ
jgi:outer membrane lipoprotein-sorting protein